ncbi:EamA family transporter [archaeon]|nr:EamA family transporter [archaeon]MBT4397558.1 EamA family transporter [archaeon]MBT4440813.1 EamA family transporter [archaeon]
MSWVLYAVLAMVGFGLFNYFVKLSAGKINVPLAVAIIAGTASIIGFIVFGYYKFTGHELVFTTQGLKFAIYAGIFTALAELFYYLMFLKDTPLSIGLPAVVGGTVVIGVVLGFVFLHETLPLLKIIGVIVTLIGITLLSI